jgi:hypothetical protein
MPKIRILKSDTGMTLFGKYISLHDFIKLKLTMDEYLSKLVESDRDDTKNRYRK